MTTSTLMTTSKQLRPGKRGSPFLWEGNTGYGIHGLVCSAICHWEPCFMSS